MGGRGRIVVKDTGSATSCRCKTGCNVTSIDRKSELEDAARAYKEGVAGFCRT